MSTLQIEIVIYKDEIEVAKRTTENWEIAEQNLESLKKEFEQKEFEKEQEGVDLSEEWEETKDHAEWEKNKK